MSLHKLYPEASSIFDIEVFPEWGDGKWAQAPYLVHGIDDVLWTDDARAAADYIAEELERALKGGIDGP